MKTNRACRCPWLDLLNEETRTQSTTSASPGAATGESVTADDTSDSSSDGEITAGLVATGAAATVAGSPPPTSDGTDKPATNTNSTLAFRGEANAAAAGSPSTETGIGAAAVPNQSTRLGRLIRKPIKLEEVNPGPQLLHGRHGRDPTWKRKVGKATAQRLAEADDREAVEAVEAAERAAATSRAKNEAAAALSCAAAAAPASLQRPKLAYIEGLMTVADGVQPAARGASGGSGGSNNASGVTGATIPGGKGAGSGGVAERCVARLGTSINNRGSGRGVVPIEPWPTPIVSVSRAPASPPLWGTCSSTDRSGSAAAGSVWNIVSKNPNVSSGDGGKLSSRPAWGVSAATIPSQLIVRTSMATGRPAAAILTGSTDCEGAVTAVGGGGGFGSGSGSGGDSGGRKKRSRGERTWVTPNPPPERPIGSMGLDPEETMREYKRSMDAVRCVR